MKVTSRWAFMKTGCPGEIFITMAKEGSTVSGLMDSFATAISLALQYGVPLKVLSDKFSHSRFEPSGYTPNPEIRYAKSVMDYIFRWLALKFLPKDAQPREDLSLVAPNGSEVENAAQLASQFTQAAGGRATVYPNGSVQPSLAGVVPERRRPQLRRLRRHHGAQRLVLQVHELRRRAGAPKVRIPDQHE